MDRIMHPEHLRLHVIRNLLRGANADQTNRRRALAKPHNDLPWRDLTSTARLQVEAHCAAARITTLLNYRAALLNRKPHAAGHGSFAALIREIDELVAALPPKGAPLTA